MVGRLRPIVIGLGLALLVVCGGLPGLAQRFFPDDPLRDEPAPFDTADPNPQALSELLDYFSNAFGSPGERHPDNGVIAAQGVNTIGDPMDGSWYTARHSRARMSVEELQRGAGDANAPDPDSPWRVLTVKAQGFRTGILIEDSSDQQYLLRFDPIDYPELATGASIIASKALYALGYWTAEDYIVSFGRSQLVAAVEGADVSSIGRLRNLLEEDIDRFLRNVPRDRESRYRALATRVPDGIPLGPFKFEGRRTDDPNDLFSHEHRRDLRGLYVFSAWLNNVAPEATSTLDMLVEEGVDGEPVRFIRHLFVDFGASLGSSTDRVKYIQEGNQEIFDGEAIRNNALSLGIQAPDWMTADFPSLPAVGRFECRTFDPEAWVPRYVPAPLANRLPDDEYWAAKTLMTLSDDDIRALVATARYTNPAAEAWVAGCLIERRDRIGRSSFSKVLPVDNFRVEDGRLVFDDLAETYGFVEPRNFQIQWSRFDNLQDQALVLQGATGAVIPQDGPAAAVGAYLMADITLEGGPVEVVNGVSEAQRVAVYLRRDPDGFRVAGVDRIWPGRVFVTPRPLNPLNPMTHYSELTDRQRELFDTYAEAYEEQTQFDLTGEAAWSILSVSEQTTFDAVTNALERTELSDAEGNDLGAVIDLCVRVDRIAGQYAGRSGDLQFRIYCDLAPGARDVLERSVQFIRDKDNTVYHAGFPLNYRQTGSAPTMQVSMAEDGARADIDVDYRDSGMPSSMWNGHITSANSDVRAGDNYDRHVGRWPGFVAWWRGLFGDLDIVGSPLVGLLTQPPPPDFLDLPPDRPAGANPESVEDAAQEFLTDWLQRRSTEQAVEFLSDQALQCMGQPDTTPVVVTSLSQARTVMRGLLVGVNDQLGNIENLAEAVQGVEPWRPEMTAGLVDHPWRRAFSLFSMPADLATGYLCNQHPALEEAATQAAAQTDPSSYYGSIFRFRFAADQGGTLGLLWAREDGRWKVVAYLVFRQ